MTSLREKIADWYFSSHKIEDRLGHNPYMEANWLGKVQNTLTGVPFKTVALSVGLAYLFNEAVYGGNSNWEFTAGILISGAFFALHERWRENMDSKPEYYVDTSPEHPPALPNDENVIRHLTREYKTCHPHRHAITVFPIISAVSGFAWTVDQPEAIPYAVAGVIAASTNESRKYWQARQALHENWQVYTDLPRRQPQRDEQRRYASTATLEPSS